MMAAVPWLVSPSEKTVAVPVGVHERWQSGSSRLPWRRWCRRWHGADVACRSLRRPGGGALVVAASAASAPSGPRTLSLETPRWSCRTAPVSPRGSVVGRPEECWRERRLLPGLLRLCCLATLVVISTTAPQLILQNF